MNGSESVVGLVHRRREVWGRARSLALAVLASGGLACSLVNSGLQALGTAAPGVSSSTGSLQVAATSAITVRLSWKPVTGATGYDIEVSFGDREPFPVAKLGADVTTYEDFPAPPDSQLTYRVRAETASGTQDVGTATLTTPVETPNPLTVKVNYEENRFVIPTIDPNNPNRDPSAYLPPGFDPNNPDMSLLQPGPKTVWKNLGAEGGKVEATSANGVKFTLTVPANSVPFSIPFGLTPVESIDGLPLTGGLIGAVRVEPQGIEFTHPLELEITPPDIAAPLSEGSKVMAFAVTAPEEGNEFYFVPQVKSEGSSSGTGGGGRLARPAGEAARVGPIPGVKINVADGKVVGVGPDSPSHVRETVEKHPPSKSTNRNSSKQAAAQQEELAPLPPVEIEQEVARAGSTEEFLQALDDFQTWVESSPRSEATADRVWDEIVLNLKVLFDKQKDKCLTRDGFAAASVAARMAFAEEGTFWSQLRDRYVKKHGQQSLDDALAYAKRCKLTLKITSKLSWNLEAGGTTLVYDVSVDVKPLLLAYESDPRSPKYGAYLRGYALVYPSKVDVNIQGCKQVILNPLPTEFVRIGLRPKFDESGNLSNFEVVDFGGGGARAELTQKCDKDSVSNALITAPQGGMWSGLYVDARRGQVAFSGFSVSSPPPSSGEIAFKWLPEPGSGGVGISGAKITEQTKFSLVLGQ